MQYQQHSHSCSAPFRIPSIAALWVKLPQAHWGEPQAGAEISKPCAVLTVQHCVIPGMPLGTACFPRVLLWRGALSSCNGPQVPIESAPAWCFSGSSGTFWFQCALIPPVLQAFRYGLCPIEVKASVCWNASLQGGDDTVLSRASKFTFKVEDVNTQN